MRRPPDLLFRVIFELHFRGKNLVAPIQDRISAFSIRSFPALIEDNLAALGKDRLLVFEQVRLEVGEVRLSRLEEDLAAGIAKCLRGWAFNAKPSSSWPLLSAPQGGTGKKGDDIRAEVGERTQREMKKTPFTSSGLSASIAAALEKPGEWPEFLSVLRDNHALRCRIADEVSPKLLGRLLTALMQDQGPCIAEFAETMIRLHGRQPLLPVNIHVFRRELWECILAELVMSSRTHLAERAFIVNVLKRLASAHLSTDHGIAANLAKALQLQPSQTIIGCLLADAICGLKSEDARGLAAKPSPTMTSRDENASRRLHELQTFLESGVLPWSLTGRDAEAEMLDLLAAVPADVRVLFRDWSEKEFVRKRLAWQFSEKAKSRLLMALAPTTARWMITFMQQLRRIHGQEQLFPVPNRHFACDLWEFCFGYLGRCQGKSFDPRSFLRHVLKQIAARRKTSYELLLSDLLLRHGPDLRAGRAAPAEEVSLRRALVGLLDEALFGIDELAPEIPRSLIDSRFQSFYSDLDVLAHWMRWHKLPHWSRATDPEETGWRLGSLFDGLPPGVQTHAARASNPDRTKATQTGTSQEAFTLPEQIKHWLAFGLWPDSILSPDASQLSTWLENQSDADWMKALEGDGPHEAMVERLSHHASPSLFERVIRLLAGRTAGLVSDYMRCLDTAGRRIAPVATQLWADQLKKYTLMYLLRASSISGRHAISVVELARSTMVALSLNCRVSYDRLLEGAEQQSSGQEELEKLCRFLRQELEVDRATPGRIEPTVPSNRDLIRPIPAVTLREPRPGTDELPRPAKSLLPGPNHVLPVSINSSSAAIADLAEFLCTGRFPSSAEVHTRGTSRGWIIPQLSGNSQLLLEMLETFATHPGTLPRLMRYVAPSELEQITRLAEPNYGGLLILYIQAGSRLHDAGTNAAVPYPKSPAAALHWQQTLAFLLDKHSSKQSAAGILRELTARVSRQLAMTHAEYLSNLLPIARRGNVENRGYAALADILEQLLSEVATAATSPTPTTLAQTERGVRGSGPVIGENQRRDRTIEAAANTFSAAADPVRNEAGRSSGDVRGTGTHADRKSDEDLAIGLPAPDDALAQLDYLLRYGELAENATQAGHEELMTNIAAELSTRSAEYRQYLLKAAGRELERTRMARLLPSYVVSLLWPILAPVHHANIAVYTEVLEQALPQPSAGGSDTICREIIVEELFKAISNSQTCRWDAAACLKSTMERLARHLSMAPYALVKRVRAVLEKRPAHARGEMPALVERIELEFAKTPLLRAARTAPLDQQPPQVRLPAKPPRSIPEGEPFYIANAGSVLLWPFLQTYFHRLGLLEKNTFRDHLSQGRAIYLLQYLATGRLEAPEHELLLNKILGGWTVEQPLEPPSPPNQSEEALSLQLLQGVLKNWEKVKSTSVEGLRSSFLMRDGKLLLKEQTWSLIVSTKAYDILLDSLPWSLKMIRLPWMKALLQVKWR